MRSSEQLALAGWDATFPGKHIHDRYVLRNESRLERPRETMCFRNRNQLSPCRAPSSHALSRDAELFRAIPGGVIRRRATPFGPSSSSHDLLQAPRARAEERSTIAERPRARSRGSLPSLGSGSSASHSSQQIRAHTPSPDARRWAADARGWKEKSASTFGFTSTGGTRTGSALGGSWSLGALHTAPIAFRPEMVQPFGHVVRRVPSSSAELTHLQGYHTTPPASPAYSVISATLAADVEAQLTGGSLRYTPRALTPRHLYRKLDTLSAID